MKLAKYFKVEKRRDSEESTFFTFAEDAPDWLRNAVYVAHHEMFPDDWVFEECWATCEAIDEGTLDPEKNEAGDDDFHSFVDGRVDPYTKDRFAWAMNLCLTLLYAEAEDRACELGFEDDARTEARLGLIQYCAIEIVAGVMLDAVRTQQQGRKMVSGVGP